MAPPGFDDSGHRGPFHSGTGNLGQEALGNLYVAIHLEHISQRNRGACVLDALTNEATLAARHFVIQEDEKGNGTPDDQPEQHHLNAKAKHDLAPVL